MVVIRNKLAQSNAGGRRQFAELRDKLLIRVDSIRDQDTVLSELDRFNITGRKLNNAPVIVAEPRTQIEDVLDRLSSMADVREDISDGISSIESARDAGEEIFEIGEEAVNATEILLNTISDIDRVGVVDFALTKADYGPENLRLRPGDIPDVTADEAEEQGPTLTDVHDRLNIEEAWEVTKGENAVIAVFDTGYAPDLISSNRIINTYHGDSVDSVFASEEGHGTMCAGAAAANKNEGVPFNGAAPEADVILVRITDNKGQIRSDIVTEAYDWMMDLDLDKPIVANHSYGTPLCSGRPRQRFCSGPEQDVVRIANSSSDITSVYAAGNEAGRCGHRPSGLTNAITGTNSLSDVITVGALLFNGVEAQRYSSHGRGDCAPISDPKPNVSMRLPMMTYYGAEGGYKIKDMSTGLFGSAGGTSHASPYTAGCIALLQSAARSEDIRLSDENIATRGSVGEPLETEEIKAILKNNSSQPRRTQINSFGLFLSSKGYDARFGRGEFKPAQALKSITGN